MHFLSVSKQIYPLIMCSPKFCSFLHILSTILCTLFHTHTVLAIRVYCNAQNIIHFYAFLIQMTAFGFARISCSRVDLILCSSPIFCRESSVICVFSKKYCTFLIFKFQNCYAPILKLRLWLYPLFS